MPRDKDNLTPIYFYSVANGTSVRRSPNSLVVALSEGYYNGYTLAFNRILWVLEKAFDNDAAKDAAINRSIADYLRGQLPEDASNQNDPSVIAWSEIMRAGETDQLFSLSILPNSPRGTGPNTVIPAAKPATTDQSFHLPQQN